MKLYLISQEQNRDYDTYDSAVVAAENEDAARYTSPDNFRTWSAKENSWVFNRDDGTYRIEDNFSSWVDDVAHVTVRLIGEAIAGTTADVICASFNAG